MSESRCGESRSYSYFPSYSSESRVSSESCTPIIGRSKPKPITSVSPIAKTKDTSTVPSKYNNFEDIDALIEQLEITIPVLEQLQSRGEKYSKPLKRRLAQIEKLRQIREERIISEIERESDEFEDKINEVKKLTLKPKKQPSSYAGWGYDSSESRDSGESRW